MEVECKILFHGVKHNDFAPRNIILAGSDIKTQMPQVFLIDFNHSTAMGRPNYKFRHRYRKATLPVNPLYRYWGPCPNEFLAWVPEPHRSRQQAFKGWLKTQWGGTKEFASREEGGARLLDYDEPVEVVPPLPDTKLASAPKFPIVFLKQQRTSKQGEKAYRLILEERVLLTNGLLYHQDNHRRDMSISDLA